MLTEKGTKLRREIQLLVWLGRKDVNENAIAQARDTLKTDIDWDYLLKAAVFHGVFPTFFKHLKANFADLVPVKCFRMMTGHNDKIRYQNLALVGTFLQFHALLEKNNIRAVMFKGPALAISLYDDLLLRDYSDVDVLVAPSDVRAAQRLLIESGYSPAPQIEPPLPIEFMQSAVFLEMECEQTFTKEVPMSVIDLHWEIQPEQILPLDFETVINHTTSLTLEGRTIKIPELSLSLLVAAAHSCKHGWLRLLWICDIAHMLEHQPGPDIDWTAVKRLSDQAFVTPMVVLGLNLAQRLYGCDIPDFAKAGFTKRLQALCDQVLSNLEILSENEAGMTLGAIKFCAQLISPWPAQLRYLATTLFQPNVADYIRFRLPLAVHKVYYLLHPFWLLTGALERRLAGIASSISRVD